MSLVVFMRSNHGIAAASDSRSTMTTNGTSYCKDDNTKKLFTNGKILLGAWGANEYIEGNTIFPISKMLDEIMSDERLDTPDAILKKIHKRLFESFAKGIVPTYNFFVGSKKDGLYFIESYSVNGSGWHFDHGGNINNALYCLSPMVPQNICTNPNWTLRELEARCCAFVEHTISLGDLMLTYNPVGGAIQRESLS